MMKETRCFADKGRYCMALIERRCAGCSFYQTKEQVEAGRASAKARLLQRFPKQYEKYNH